MFAKLSLAVILAFGCGFLTAYWLLGAKESFPVVQHPVVVEKIDSPHEIPAIIHEEIPESTKR